MGKLNSSKHDKFNMLSTNFFTNNHPVIKLATDQFTTTKVTFNTGSKIHLKTVYGCGIVFEANDIESVDER